DKLYIKLSGHLAGRGFDFTITDLNGRIIEQVQNTNASPAEINLQAIEKGLYFLQIHDTENGFIICKKLIVE
ncbi:MAG: T9SS type A sorting domain-containing protein, partial [Bacteroidales bacterium]|nr:T9SS type A sorting domain-containing protein [Bacteroidales bacterium]